MRTSSLKSVFAYVALALIATISTLSIPSTTFATASDDAQLKKELEMQKAFGEIKGMSTIVKHLAESNLSCSTAADCVAMPMGSRACGGPTSFVVTSTANTSLDVLTQAVSLVTKAERDVNRKFGMMSICSVEMPPAIGCNNNLCETL